MLRRLASLVVARPRLVLVVTVVFLLIAGTVGGGVTTRLKSGGFDDPSSESARAQQVLDTHFTGTPNFVLLVTDRTGAAAGVDTPEVASAGEEVARRVATTPGVTEVTSYWSTDASSLRSRDGRSALVMAHLSGTPEQATERAGEIVEELASGSGPVSVQAGGPLGLNNDINNHVDNDLKRAEAIAIPITLMLLVIVFGSVVAALLPIGVGLLSILGTLLVLFALSLLTDVSVYAMNVATAAGLGLSIDYGLLMVSRFHEERAAGHEHDVAVARAVQRAGRTIVFSAATVAVALTSLIVFPLYFLQSIAFAVIAVVGVATIGAVVVLPALLVLLGHRVDALAPRLPGRRRSRSGPRIDSPFWRRTAAAVTRRPVLCALPILAVLLLMAMPFLHVKFAIADERTLPAGSEARQVAVAMREDFPGGETANALTVVTSTGGDRLAAYAERISTLPNATRVDGAFGSYQQGRLVAGPSPDSARFTAGQAAYLQVVPTSAPSSQASQDLVRAVRDLPEPAGTDMLVGGPTALLIDSNAALVDDLPLALGLIAVTTFILLFLFTGSVVLPLKALVLNALTIVAVLGAMTWIFQDGHLIQLLGSTPMPMNTPMVVLLCVLAFGLSMDYEVFLLSRIKEAHDAGAAMAEAVAEGLGRTGRIMTSAAALLAVTLVAFATSGVSFMQMFGLGTALAILLDATLVRGVLVPAFMRVAGTANWWAPAPLRRLHNRFGLSEGEPEGKTQAEPAVVLAPTAESDPKTETGTEPGVEAEPETAPAPAPAPAPAAEPTAEPGGKPAPEPEPEEIPARRRLPAVFRMLDGPARTFARVIGIANRRVRRSRQAPHTHAGRTEPETGDVSTPRHLTAALAAPTATHDQPESHSA